MARDIGIWVGMWRVEGKMAENGRRGREMCVLNWDYWRDGIIDLDTC